MIRLSSSFTGLEGPAMLEEPRCFVIAQFNAHVTLNGFRDHERLYTTVHNLDSTNEVMGGRLQP